MKKSQIMTDHFVVESIPYYRDADGNFWSTDNEGYFRPAKIGDFELPPLKKFMLCDIFKPWDANANCTNMLDVFNTLTLALEEKEKLGHGFIIPIY